MNKTKTNRVALGGVLCALLVGAVCLSALGDTNSAAKSGTQLLNGIALLDQVKAAAAKLESVGHRWELTHPQEPGRKDHGRIGSLEGETDGKVTHVKVSTGPSEIEMAYSSKKIGFNVGGAWQYANSADPEMAGARVWMYKTAGALAVFIANGATSATNADDGIVAELGEKVATDLLAGYYLLEKPGRATRDVHGWTKFWIKDGVLLKFRSHVTGTLLDPSKGEVYPSVDNTQVEIKEAGRTTVNLPGIVKTQLF
jgi:hypothetical protein